jgi:hypothetical protein
MRNKTLAKRRQVVNEWVQKIFSVTASVPNGRRRLVYHRALPMQELLACPLTFARAVASGEERVDASGVEC